MYVFVSVCLSVCLYVCLCVCHLVREEKHVKLLRYVSCSGVHDLYVHNIFSPSMVFSDDGSLFAYFDGSKSVTRLTFVLTFVLTES